MEQIDHAFCSYLFEDKTFQPFLNGLFVGRKDKMCSVIYLNSLSISFATTSPLIKLGGTPGPGTVS